MTYCTIRIKVKFYTQYSESIRIVGNLEQLGSWNPSLGLPLITNAELYPYWETENPIKAPQGTKVEFKTVVFSQGQLVRWETLPNGENRRYRVRYHRVFLEWAEANPFISETIEQKFKSSASLQNLARFKKIKNSDQIFNPFEKAQSSISSDSYGDSSADQSSIGGYVSPRNLDRRLGISDDEDTVDTGEREDEIKFLQGNKKAHEWEHDANPSKYKRQTSRNSNFRKSCVGLDDKRPDIFSVLYEEYIKDFSEHKQEIDTESYADSQDNYLEDEMVELVNEQPIVIACFRLPITITLMNPNEKVMSKKWKIMEDNCTYQGTVYKFRKEQAKGMMWIGWIGSYIEPIYRKELEAYLSHEFNCIPIFLEETQCKTFLFEYCNKFLHGAFFGLLNFSTVSSQEDYILTYNTINQIFASKILDCTDHHTLVLIQDYHLMMVPRFLSQRNSKLTLAYVFNTPFPASDIMKTFQNARDLANSLMCVDLICFNSNESMKALLSLCTQVSGTEILSEKGGHIYLARDGRKIYLKTSHPRVDFDRLLAMKDKPTYQQIKNCMEEKYKGKTILLGLSHFLKLEGLENLLQSVKQIFESHRDYEFKLFLVYCEDNYRFDSKEPDKKEFLENMKNKVDAINQELFHQGLSSDIEIIEKELLLEEKFSLMQISHLFIALSPYIENSINILDYILIKSRCAEAEKSILGKNNSAIGIIVSDLLKKTQQLSSPILVNPFSKKRLVEGIEKALSRDREITSLLVGSDNAIAAEYSAWDQFYEFLLDLKRAQTLKSKLTLMNLETNGEFKIVSVKSDFQPLDGQVFYNDYKEAKKKIIICSYEDTFFDSQHSDFPHKDFESLKSLCSDHTLELFVVSEKKASNLIKAFQGIDNVTLLAENGFFYKIPYGNTWYNMYKCDWSWKTIVQRIMQNYASRVGGSKVEIKESSILWSYKNFNSEVATIQKEELANHLTSVLTHVENVEIIKGNLSVEVKAKGINKGVAADLIMERIKLLKGNYPDFVLCIGGTSKDEEMFKRIKSLFKEEAELQNAKYYNCTVGKKLSKAKYYVEKIDDVFRILDNLAKSSC